MTKRRVVITGLGTVNPIGNNVDETWKNALAGKSGIGRITRFDPKDLKSQIAGEVKNFDPSQVVSHKEAKRMDPFTVYGMVAASEAVDNSGIDFSKEVPEDCGCIVGVGMGGIETFQDQLRKCDNKGPSRVSPFFIPMMIPDILAGHVAIRYGLMGHNYSVASACASSGHAIGSGYQVIANGEQTIMVCGGAESVLIPVAVAGFNSARALSTRNDDPEKASRPFDKDRDGFIMAEGGAMVVLEEYEHAKKRGAAIIAEMVGFGFTCDAFHITSPHEEGKGAIIAMKKAIQSARINPESITHINAHGTSTALNDSTETKAIKDVFGDHAKNITICSTKSMTGHMLGAAGAMETIFSSLALKEQIVPPTINYENPDPECDLFYNPNSAKKMEFDYALSNSFGFGGHNASLLFKKI